MKKTYIPHGSDQQGRRETGVYVFTESRDQGNGMSIGEAIIFWAIVIAGFLLFVSVVVEVVDWLMAALA